MKSRNVKASMVMVIVVLILLVVRVQDASAQRRFFEGDIPPTYQLVAGQGIEITLGAPVYTLDNQGYFVRIFLDKFNTGEPDKQFSAGDIMRFSVGEGPVVEYNFDNPRIRGNFNGTQINNLLSFEDPVVQEWQNNDNKGDTVRISMVRGDGVELYGFLLNDSRITDLGRHVAGAVRLTPEPFDIDTEVIPLPLGFWMALPMLAGMGVVRKMRKAKNSGQWSVADTGECVSM